MNERTFDEKRIFQIGVFGSADGDSVDECEEKAWIIGMEIAEHHCVLITGACPGLPHQAATGASRRNGRIIGISPAMNLREHIEKYKYPATSFYYLVFTGMERKGRNIISLRSCDAAIFIAGRIGTLNEFTIAYDEAPKGFVIGILTDSGGFSNDFSRLAKQSNKDSKADIIEDNDPRLLVGRILEELHNWQVQPLTQAFEQGARRARNGK